MIRATVITSLRKRGKVRLTKTVYLLDHDEVVAFDREWVRAPATAVMYTLVAEDPDRAWR